MYKLNKNLAYTYLDIFYYPDYPHDNTILPGLWEKPNECLSDFVKTDNVLWFLSNRNIPMYLNSTWEEMTPIIIEWFNDRFGNEFGFVNKFFKGYS